ncbi:dTDP-4-dehydrorhamnose 3,5-epimerase family protein [Candidatus Gottesmanbacteria bacterium]|nr:dTDP-4-dehydrorhamnose 3,5-epimerase family protein [Candidatus Gottesmanbacteria bacterium]
METIDKVRGKIYIQKYQAMNVIEGVKIVDLKNHLDEESDFGELLRLTDSGKLELFPNFSLKQINRTRLNPGSVKAWHVHFQQDELWYIFPSNSLIVGLWDIRARSKTQDVTMRMVLGGGNSQLLLIPKGVAHGSANISLNHVDMLYFTNQHFNSKDPDEGRINWDILGSDFWKPVRD